jgi:hypothetical protein
MLFTVEFTLEVEAATAEDAAALALLDVRTTPEVCWIDVYSDAPESRHSRIVVDPGSLDE